MPDKTLEAEIICLNLPVNAAYVSAARLTASSIANRMGFDIDEIEDVKAGVSEACTYIIRKLEQEQKSGFRIEFEIRGAALTIRIETDGIMGGGTDDEMSLVMIKALMDEVTVFHSEGLVSLMLVKEHKTGIF